MSFITDDINGSCAKICFNRSPVNALNYDILNELNYLLSDLEKNPEIKLIIFSGGNSKFFSFGLDIPEILDSGRTNLKKILLLHFKS